MESGDTYFTALFPYILNQVHALLVPVMFACFHMKNWGRRVLANSFLKMGLKMIAYHGTLAHSIATKNVTVDSTLNSSFSGNATSDLASNLTFDDFGVSSDGIRVVFNLFYLFLAWTAISELRILVPRFDRISATCPHWQAQRRAAEKAVSHWTASALVLMPLAEAICNLQSDMPAMWMFTLTSVGNATKFWLTYKRLLWLRHLQEEEIRSQMHRLAAFLMPTELSPVVAKRSFFDLWREAVQVQQDDISSKLRILAPSSKPAIQREVFELWCEAMMLQAVAEVRQQIYIERRLDAVVRAQVQMTLGVQLSKPRQVYRIFFRSWYGSPLLLQRTMFELWQCLVGHEEERASLAYQAEFELDWAQLIF